MTERDDSNSDKLRDAVVGLNALRMNNSNGQNRDEDREALIIRGVEALADLPESEFDRIIGHLGPNGKD